MLEFRVERAFEPEMMERRPCGVCGKEFQPEAVLAQLVTSHEFKPVCEVCLSHLARRAEEEPIHADWDEVYRRYLRAVRIYTEPVFSSVEAVMEAEDRDPKGTRAMECAAVFYTT